ncbi:MAG TPA: stage II sporulation protein M [Bryobacteraceae bacterium]
MIVDLARFVETERPHWTALEQFLKRLDDNPGAEMPMGEAQRLHYLYQRTSSALGRVGAMASEPELRGYLEWLVSRAYAEIHESRGRRRFHAWEWVSATLPHAFRRRIQAFAMSTLLTIGGVAFGAGALAIDPDAKSVLMPFEHLQMTPHERVALEREDKGKRLEGRKATFSAQLMQNNTRVSILAMGLGMTFGVGTVVLLFYNGVILGAVAYDYVTGGETIFLLGWLLPHGVIEIPAILLAGQAGLLIAHALIGWGSRQTRRQRLREISHDVVTLICGAALFLVWAGIIEAFFSQYHEPVVPYGVKISFGLVELTALIFYLSQSGRKKLA